MKEDLKRHSNGTFGSTIMRWKFAPSYYGVRLSFALSDWVELGTLYPKALDTLKGIRAEKTSRFSGRSADGIYSMTWSQSTIT